MAIPISDRAVQLLVENRIREAIEQGKFERLPGAGEPISDLDQPYDPDWWVKRKVREDDISEAMREFQRMQLEVRRPPSQR